MSRKHRLNAQRFSDDLSIIERRIKGFKRRLWNARKDNDIYSQIETLLQTAGYIYNLDKVQKEFTITVSPNFFIKGSITKSKVQLWVKINYGIKNYEHLSKIMTDFAISDLDLFRPLIDRLICELSPLIEEYDKIQKIDKSAEFLESVILNYLEKYQVILQEHTKVLYPFKGVSADDDGKLWVFNYVTDDIVIRAPVDINDYESQCDAWIKVISDPSCWETEHKGTDVQVLKKNSERDRWGTHLYWLNMATGNRCDNWLL